MLVSGSKPWSSNRIKVLVIFFEEALYLISLLDSTLAAVSREQVVTKKNVKKSKSALL